MDYTGRKAAYDTSTDEVFLFFIEINESSLDEPLRFVGSKSDLIVNDTTYVGYPFMLNLPSDDGETVSSVELVIGNVDRELNATIRSIQSGLEATYWIALASSPEIVQEGPFTMGLTSVKMDALTITGTLTTEPIMAQGVCDFTVTPVTCPGLFKGVTT